MKRVLITGMSGTGKSAVIRELIARGYQAHDLDTPEWSEWVDAESGDDLTPAEGKDWVWRLDKVRTLLSGATDSPLFISGCAENMEEMFPLIEMVILLSAPIDTIMARLTSRTPEGYGHFEEERQRVTELIQTIEPLLREGADHEIDTSGSVAATVDEILTLV